MAPELNHPGPYMTFFTGVAIAPRLIFSGSINRIAQETVF
jgi:hypothetical protein